MRLVINKNGFKEATKIVKDLRKRIDKEPKLRKELERYEKMLEGDLE